MRLLPWSVSVELRAAHWATIVIFEPVFDASSVESMLARQLAAGLPLFALLKADVAVRGLTALSLLRQVADVVLGAAA